MTRRATAAVLFSFLTLAGVFAEAGLPAETAATDRVASVRRLNVVNITTRLDDAGSTAAGTGIVLGAGEVLTNNHVIRGGTDIHVATPGGHRYPARVLGTDATHDIALLEVTGADDVRPATLGDSSRLALREPISAIGNAHGDGGTPAVASGRVTGLHRSITTTDETGADAEHLSGLIRTDAPIEPGYSGGPLVNAAGEVVGVDTAARVDQPGEHRAAQGFAIPINRAIRIARDIEAGRESEDIHVGPAPKLGVALLGDGVYQIPGVFVTDVTPGSPAEGAGLSPGDRITSFEGTPVASTATFASQLQRHHPGDDVQLQWTDPVGVSHVASVELATGPPA